MYYRHFLPPTQIRPGWGILSAMDQSPPEAETRTPPGLSARQAALGILSQWRPGPLRHARSVEDLLDQQALPARERGLLHELVLGVVRHWLPLKHLLVVISGRKWKDIHPRLQPILLLGAYQLIWLDGIPPFAAVSEAVGQAKCEAGPPAGRFVNAVLRQLVRQIEHRRIEPARCDPARAIPVDLSACCQFRTAVLPDPAHQPIEHLALATSHPVWLVARWASSFGLDTARQVCLAGMCRPAMILRPNPLRTDLFRLADSLRAEGIETQPDESSGALVVISHTVQLARTAAFAAGLFQVQDRTAMDVVQAMNPQPGQTIVDLCAGPGTKTTQMAEMTKDRGRILASDKDDERLAPVRENCGRLGLTAVQTVPPRQRETVFGSLERIDWILVDAPCSNTGVLARRPEARYRASRQSLKSLATLQIELLAEADRFAGPHTRLAYSTCSLETEENEGLAARFAQEHPRWRLTASRRTFPQAGPEPGQWFDGGFWAIWQRA